MNFRECLWAILKMAFVTFLVCFSFSSPHSQADAAQITGLSPTMQPTCDCIPENISKSLEQMANVTSQLADQLHAAETRETDAQNELAEARAEIERLKTEVALLNYGRTLR